MELSPQTMWRSTMTNSTERLSPFNLDSAYLTAQIVNGMQVEVQGFVDTQLIYDNTYTLNESSPSFIAFGYTGITGVRFLPVNPVTIFVMDNLTVSAVPEPSTNGLLIFGAAWLGLGSLVNRHAKEQSRG